MKGQKLKQPGKQEQEGIQTEFVENDWSQIFRLPTASKKTKLRLLELPESERKLKKGLKVGDKVGQYGVYMGERGVYHTGNPLNDLTGKEWVLFTKSWFIHNPPARKKDEMLHPAKFPESMIADFIRFFTKRNQTVLDPMLGSGSTLVACIMTERRGVGVELITRWAKIAKERTGRLQVSGQPEQTVIEGDARDLVSLFEAHGIGQADFCITSPPYWNMLKKSRGHVNSEAKRRKASGLDVYYSENPNDLGNIESYEDYLDAMYGLFVQVHDVLKDGGYLVIIAQNILTPEGEMVPLAWDLAKRLSTLYILKQERLWLQDNKMLGCWGYPWEYVSNVHHHYCLIFKKDVSLRRKLSEESHKPPEDTSDRATAPASAEGYREVVG